MSGQVNTVFTGKDESLSRTLRNIEGSTTRLDKVLGNLRGRIRTAFEFHVINRGINLFERGIQRVLGILPDLINRGEDWARTVDRIVDITGMSAAQASELAAVAENVGVNADGLGRMMNALARSVSTNADQFRDYGIRVKDANGHMLDGYTIFQNVRQRIAEMGPSLQAAKLSQMAFGRAALESADMLTLSNREWQRQIELARQSGLIMTEAGLAAAEEWERTQGRLQQAITGIGAQILQGVAPALIGLTNGVTRVINANMDSIVRFGAGLVNFLANLAADLLGVQIDTTTLIGNAYDDAAKKSERLRQRVDDMTNANQRSAASHRANAAAAERDRKEQQRLREELERAQAQLRRERRATTFTGDMNGVELELWRQQKAASVKQAQERVADARKALADHRTTMGKMTGVTASAARRMRLDLQKTFGGGGVKGTIIEGLDQTLRDSKTFALGISDAIKDAIFGEDQQIQLGGGAPIEIRSGGLLDGLKKVGDVLGTVGGHLGTLNVNMPSLVTALVGLRLAILGRRILDGVPTGGGGSGGSGRTSTILGVAGVLGAIATLVDSDTPRNLQRGRPIKPSSIQDEHGRFNSTFLDQLAIAIQDAFFGGPGGGMGRGTAGPDGVFPRSVPRNDLLSGIAAEYSVSGIGASVNRSVAAYLKTIFNGKPGGAGGFTPDWNLINGVMPGFGMNGSGLSGITALSNALDRSQMGRALGTSGEVPLALSNIATGINSLWTLIDERLPGGGTGTNPPPPNGATITDRVKTLERQMTGVEKSALLTASQRQDRMFARKEPSAIDKARIQGDRTLSQNKANKSDVISKSSFQTFRNNWYDILLDGGNPRSHQARLRALEGSDDGRGRTARSSRSAAAHETAVRKTSDNTSEMVSLLRQIAKNTRTGSPGGRTSSLRPAV